MESSNWRQRKEQGNLNVDELIDAVERLEKLVKDQAALIEKLSKSNRLDKPFSVGSMLDEKKPKPKRKPKRRRGPGLGRKLNDEKLKAAVRTETVWPAQFEKSQCTFSHTRPIIRLENHRPVVVAYDVWVHKPTKTYGKIPGVIGRSGFGIEFIISVAYQAYFVGLSYDRISMLTLFFQQIKLSKSQIDSMLSQLSQHMQGQFDSLCDLLTKSLIVHSDETSWSLKSVWTFVSEKARILLHGVNKNASTLEAILNPATFEGLVISDDASVYAQFKHQQKCWSHLIRKAVRISLMAPHDEKYKTFCEKLVTIYRDACRIKADQRFGIEGRREAVEGLTNAVIDLVQFECDTHTGKYEGAKEEYRLLIHELLKLAVDESLFEFVITADATSPNGQVVSASGTNNEAERSLRPVAIARKVNRGNKTLHGSRRQTVIVSVIDSLRYYVNEFNLESIINEFLEWEQEGMSCFEKELKKLTQSATKPPQSILDLFFPKVQAA